MKTIITSALLAIAVFSMAAIPTTNKSEKKDHKTVAVKPVIQNDKNDQSKSNMSSDAKKAQRNRALIESKNGIWNSNNGGGRISYH